MRESIEQSSVDVDDGLSKDFIDIFSKAESKDVSPFMNLTWKQQQKCLNHQNQKGIDFAQ